MLQPVSFAGYQRSKAKRHVFDRKDIETEGTSAQEYTAHDPTHHTHHAVADSILAHIFVNGTNSFLAWAVE